MTQSFVRAAFYRGGTSKGVVFHARDLPAQRARIDAQLLAVIGSPDPYGRQLDGMGGGLSSLSKAVIIGPPTHPDADVDYTFVQLAVDSPVADWSGNCGNLSSAVGPFAVDEGLVPARDGEACVRIHQTNTGKLIHARFEVRGGKTVVAGDYAIAGVAGTGARIRLDFLDPAGAATGRLLPTGRVVDRIDFGAGETYDVSLIDATTPIAYLDAAALGLDGTESPDRIEAISGVMDRIERIRRGAGVLMGLATTEATIGLQTPRVALVAPPRAYRSLDGERWPADRFDIATRVISMQRAHKAIPGTVGLNLGVAARIEATIPHRLARAADPATELRVANPSGLVSVGAAVDRVDGQWHARSAVLYRTARRLMQGEVAIPASLTPPCRGSA
jgi:hypothetical protein